MAASSKSHGHHKDSKRGHRTSPDAVGEGSGSSSSGTSKLDVVSRAIMSPFTSRKHDSAKILTERACFSL